MMFVLPLLIAIAALLGLPVDAWAGVAPDAKGSATVLAQQSSNIPKLIAVGAYVIGTYFAVKGLLALRGWVAEPEKNPILKAIAYSVVSALLIALPYTITIFTGTIKADNFKIDNASGSFIEQGMANTTTKDFHQAQYNLSKQSLNIPKLVTVLAYIGGTFFAATGLLRLKDWINDSDRNPLLPALFRLITAALMIAFPHILLVTTATFFSYGSGSNASVEVNVSTKMGKLSPFQKIN